MSAHAERGLFSARERAGALLAVAALLGTFLFAAIAVNGWQQRAGIERDVRQLSGALGGASHGGCETEMGVGGEPEQSGPLDAEGQDLADERCGLGF